MDVVTTNEKIIFAQLKAQVDDWGYIIRVFECLEERYNNAKYIMCTQFPQWNQRAIAIGEKGYLKIRELIAGKTGWYDPNTQQMVAYNYDNIQFIKFISQEEDTTELYTDGAVAEISKLDTD